MAGAKNPKIILVNPYIGGIPGLGLAYLASYLRERLNIKDIEILQKKFYPSLAEAIIERKPDIVGYFSLTAGLEDIYQLIEKISSELPSAVQIMGGPHITALPKSLSLNAAVGVVGEGEETFAELVRVFESYGKLPVSELRKIKGVCFYDKNQLIKTDRREPVMNLDSLPKPARDLLNIKGYFPANLRAFPTKIYRSSCLMTTRGCPFSCVFCQQGFYGPKFRFHSPARVIEEIEELVNVYGCDFIEIQDDQFLCNKQRLREIVNGIKSKGIEKRAAFFCYIRATQADEEVMKMLKEMNTKLIFIGFESGSDKVLKYLKDNTCSVETNQRAYDLARKYKIYVYGAFIFGAPNETMEDMERTYEFMKKNPMSLCEVSRLTPFPGTGIWNYAAEKGFVDPDMNFQYFKVRVKDNRVKKLWLCENVSREEFLKFFHKKVEPLSWRYVQTAHDFSMRDLFNREFIKRVIKDPKFYLSVAKRTIESVLTAKEK